MINKIERLLNKFLELMPKMAGFFGLAVVVIISFTVSPLFLTLPLSTSPLIQNWSFLAVVIILLIVSIQSALLNSNNPSTTLNEKTVLPTGQSQDLETRLFTLTNALKRAGDVINAIETEMQSRQELVKRLESQKAIAERAIELSQEQVEAVSALLSEQVSKQSKEDKRRELLKDILFFIAGVLVTIALGRLGIVG